MQGPFHKMYKFVQFPNEPMVLMLIQPLSYLMAGLL